MELGKAVTDLVESRLVELVADGYSCALHCTECLRFSLCGKPIEHAESCKTGRVATLALKLLTSDVAVEEMRSARERMYVHLRTPSEESHIEYLDPPVRMTHEEAALHAAGIQ